MKLSVNTLKNHLRGCCLCSLWKLGAKKDKRQLRKYKKYQVPVDCIMGIEEARIYVKNISTVMKSDSGLTKISELFAIYQS